MQSEKLAVTLTEEEMAKLAEEMGALEIELAAVREAKKASSRNFKGKIDLLQEAIDEKAEIATSGQEMRFIDCEWRKDILAGVKRLVRLDTDREVRNMLLSEEERQQSLFFGQEVEPEVPEGSTDEQVAADTKAEFASEAVDPFDSTVVDESGIAADFDAALEKVAEQAAADDDKADASFINSRTKGRKKKKVVPPVASPEAREAFDESQVPF